MRLRFDSRTTTAAVLLGFLLGLLSFGGCVSDSDGVIPITTSSPIAREHFLTGRDLTERLRNPEAFRHFERALKADPEFGLAYLYLAGVHPSPKGFFENLELAHKYSDGLSKGERLLIEGTQAGVDGNPSRQSEIFRELVELYPNDLRARMLLANQFFGVQDYEAAVAAYEVVVQMNESYAPPYNMLGYSQRSLGNYEAAARAFEKYIALIPDDPNPYDSYAELLTRMGQFEESIESYRRALEADPTFGASRLGIASNLVFLDRHAEAREELAAYFDEAVNSGQQQAALLAAAVTCVDEGNFDQALVMLQQRYDMAKDDSDAAAMSNDLTSVAFVQLLSGQPDAAEENYDRALELIESSKLFDRVKRVARENNIVARAQVALARGDLTEAWNLAQEYLSVTETARNIIRIRAAHSVVGRVAVAQREFDTAIAHLEKANLELGWNRFHLATAYEGKGDSTRAADLFQSAATTYELNNLRHAAIRREALRRAEQLGQ